VAIARLPPSGCGLDSVNCNHLRDSSVILSHHWACSLWLTVFFCYFVFAYNPNATLQPTECIPEGVCEQHAYVAYVRNRFCCDCAVNFICCQSKVWYYECWRPNFLQSRFWITINMILAHAWYHAYLKLYFARLHKFFCFSFFKWL